MYGLLIVDDEIHAAHGIESGIDWSELGISNVYLAYNIRQAKEMFMNHSVHLMICDIEMPQGNGIELLTWVKENHPLVESLFLTCHADFEYAKQALQLGSLDYMLKPVRYEELENVVRKAIRKIESEREAHVFTETMKHYYQLWSEHRPLVIERFWLDLIHQAVSSQPQQIIELLQRRDIPFNEQSQFVPVLISIKDWSKPLSDREKKIMNYALRNAAEHSFQLDSLEGGCIIQISESHMVVLLTEEHPLLSSISGLGKAFKEYMASCSEYFYCDLSCYIGRCVGISEIRVSVEALIQMDGNNVTNSRKLYYLDEKVDPPGSIELPNISNWLELLKQGSKAALLEELEMVLDAMKMTECDAKVLQHFYHNFLQMVYHVLQVKGLQAHLIFSENMSPREAALATRSVTNLEEWSKQIVEMAIDFIRSIEESHTVIDRVKKYISENIDKDLSRDDIAEFIFLSPDYLSRIFKKETGMSLSDYLIEERFKFARTLLLDSDMSVSEIAASIGYTNFSHFSKMFKRVTDMNPLEFRKRNRQ